jgi:phosphoribosylformimino-5-aminoimidazole carboxamide ribotide isomerase
MMVIPALDLREGACVQLVGGEYEREQIRIDDPAHVLRTWARYGFTRVHMVDLDGATGRGSNRALVHDLLREAAALPSFLAQVGGGIRTTERVEELFADGAGAVIVGTRAVEEPEWLREIAHANPGEIIVALDVRERRVVTRGWARTLPRNVVDMVEELNALPLGGILVTAVHKEGQLQGTDLPLMEDVAEAADCPVFASGGITTISDLRALEDRGVAAAVLGMALYTGVLDPWSIAEEFAQ